MLYKKKRLEVCMNRDVTSTRSIIIFGLVYIGGKTVKE